MTQDQGSLDEPQQATQDAPQGEHQTPGITPPEQQEETPTPSGDEQQPGGGSASVSTEVEVNQEAPAQTAPPAGEGTSTPPQGEQAAPADGADGNA